MRDSYLGPLNCQILVKEIPVCLPVDQPTRNLGYQERESTQIFLHKKMMKNTTLTTILEHSLYVEEHCKTFTNDPIANSMNQNCTREAEKRSYVDVLSILKKGGNVDTCDNPYQFSNYSVKILQKKFPYLLILLRSIFSLEILITCCQTPQMYTCANEKEDSQNSFILKEKMLANLLQENIFIICLEYYDALEQSDCRQNQIIGTQLVLNICHSILVTD